jgi:hypothetical protein
VVNAANGLPVSRALVQLNDRALLTDHEGKFVFDRVDSGNSTGFRNSANLQVTKPGYYSSPEGETTLVMQLRSDQLSAPVTVRLFPEALLTGIITSVDGTPLPRVQVTAQRSQYNESGHQWNPAGQSQTNSRGEFRIVVPPGDYRVETGYSPRVSGTSKVVIPYIFPAISSSNALETIHLATGTEEHLDLHPDVTSAYPVTLRIESQSDRGFPMITARSSSGAVIPVNVNRLQGESGTRIELPVGTYTLTANLNMGDISEYGETTVTVTGQNNPEAVLHMASIPAIPVEVVVDQAPGSSTTSDKAPTPQQLGLMMNDTQHLGSRRGSSSLGLVTIRDRGSYFHAMPGTYRLVSRNSGQWYVKAATFGATDLLQQDLVVAQGSGNSPILVTVSNQTGSLQGTARLSGVPSSAWIYLIPTATSTTPAFSTRSSPEGTFNFPYLPPGSYQAIGFELRHQDDYRDPKALARYSTFTHAVTITSGNKVTFDVDAVPSSEMVP